VQCRRSTGASRATGRHPNCHGPIESPHLKAEKQCQCTEVHARSPRCLSQAVAYTVVKKGICGDFILCGLSPPVSPKVCASPRVYLLRCLAGRTSGASAFERSAWLSVHFPTLLARRLVSCFPLLWLLVLSPSVSSAQHIAEVSAWIQQPPDRMT
jgi:hypothetical protein